MGNIWWHIRTFKKIYIWMVELNHHVEHWKTWRIFVLADCMLSYLKYYAYWGFKSSIWRTKYFQWQIVIGYVIINLQMKKIKFELSLFSFNKLYQRLPVDWQHLLTCPFLLPRNLNQTNIRSHSIWCRMNKCCQNLKILGNFSKLFVSNFRTI